jgi:thiol-disulfide isomerase/thioredoxin
MPRISHYREVEHLVVDSLQWPRYAQKMTLSRYIREYWWGTNRTVADTAAVDTMIKWYAARYPESQNGARLRAWIAENLLLPDSTLPDVPMAPLMGSRDTFRLTEQMGVLTVLHVYSHWCGPCIESFPDVRRVERQFRNVEGVQFVHLAVQSDSAKAARLMQKYGFRGRFVIDDDRTDTAFKTLQLTGVGALMVFDREGRRHDLRFNDAAGLKALLREQFAAKRQ